MLEAVNEKAKREEYRDTNVGKRMFILTVRHPSKKKYRSGWCIHDDERYSTRAYYNTRNAESPVGPTV